MKETKEDRIWKKAVKERDNYTCQVCGKKDKRLNSAHILPWEIKETRNDIMNGITLCVNCHTFRKLSCHKNPLWFSEWLMEHKPTQYYHCMQKLKEWLNQEEKKSTHMDMIDWDNPVKLEKMFKPLNKERIE